MSTVTVTGTANSEWLDVVVGQSIEVTNTNWSGQTVTVQMKVGGGSTVHTVQKDAADWTPGADDNAVADTDCKMRLAASSLTGTATLRRGALPARVGA